MPKHTLTGNIKRHRADFLQGLGKPARCAGLFAAQVTGVSPNGVTRFYICTTAKTFLTQRLRLPDVEWGVDETAQRLIRELIEPLIIVAVANIGEERIHEYAPTPGVIEPKGHPGNAAEVWPTIMGNF